MEVNLLDINRKILLYIQKVEKFADLFVIFLNTYVNIFLKCYRFFLIYGVIFLC